MWCSRTASCCWLQGKPPRHWAIGSYSDSRTRKKLANLGTDVLITDLDMPGVDGFELLRTLRQNPQFNRMTTLVLSALTAEEIEAKGGLPEGSIFMAKPINMDWFNGFFTAFLAGRYIELHTQENNKTAAVQV